MSHSADNDVYFPCLIYQLQELVLSPSSSAGLFPDDLGHGGLDPEDDDRTVLDHLPLPWTSISCYPSGLINHFSMFPVLFSPRTNIQVSSRYTTMDDVIRGNGWKMDMENFKFYVILFASSWVPVLKYVISISWRLKVYVLISCTERDLP